MNGSHNIYQSKDKKTGINVGLVNYKFLANLGLLGLNLEILFYLHVYANYIGDFKHLNLDFYILFICIDDLHFS